MADEQENSESKEPKPPEPEVIIEGKEPRPEFTLPKSLDDETPPVAGLPPGFLDDEEEERAKNRVEVGIEGVLERVKEAPPVNAFNLEFEIPGTDPREYVAFRLLRNTGAFDQFVSDMADPGKKERLLRLFSRFVLDTLDPNVQVVFDGKQYSQADVFKIYAEAYPMQLEAAIDSLITIYGGEVAAFRERVKKD